MYEIVVYVSFVYLLFFFTLLLSRVASSGFVTVMNEWLENWFFYLPWESFVLKSTVLTCSCNMKDCLFIWSERIITKWTVLAPSSYVTLMRTDFFTLNFRDRARYQNIFLHRMQAPHCVPTKLYLYRRNHSKPWKLHSVQVLSFTVT